MLEHIFESVLEMSVTASYAIAAVLMVRLLLHRSPRWISCALWSVVLFRLVCPVSFSSAFSLPRFHWATGAAASPQGALPALASSSAAQGSAASSVPQAAVQAAGQSASGGATLPEIAAVVWLLGVAAILVYAAASCLAVRGRVGAAVRIRDNIYRSDAYGTPFVFGLFRPRIYLPGGPCGDEKYILLHEEAHIRRGDHILKPAAFLAAAVHWFNPLAWLAFALMARDMEMSCDERVLGQLGSGVKAEYGDALLAMAPRRRSFSAVPLAFGESSTKERVKNVIRYKKSPKWAVALSIVICAAAIAACAANPSSGAASSGQQTEEISDFSALSYEELTARAASDLEKAFNGAVNMRTSEEYMSFQNLDVAEFAKYNFGTISYDPDADTLQVYICNVNGLLYSSNGYSSSGEYLSYSATLTGGRISDRSYEPAPPDGDYKTDTAEGRVVNVYSSDGRLAAADDARLAEIARQLYDIMTATEVTQLADQSVEHLEILADGSLYFANLQSVPEFGGRNEGSAAYDSAADALTVHVTISTGTSTGALEGPSGSFTVGLGGDGTVVSRSYEPEPDNEFFTHTRDYDGSLETASDARLIEIARELYAIMQKGDASKYYFNFMQPNTIVIYDENCERTIVQGGELSADEISGRADIAAMGLTGSTEEMRIAPNTKVDYGPRGDFMNIYYKLSGNDFYQLDPTSGSSLPSADGDAEIEALLAKIDLERYPHSSDFAIDAFKKHIRAMDAASAKAVLEDDELVYSMLFNEYWGDAYTSSDLYKKKMEANNESARKIISAYADGSAATGASFQALPSDFVFPKSIPDIRFEKNEAGDYLGKLDSADSKYEMWITIGEQSYSDTQSGVAPKVTGVTFQKVG